MSRKCFILLISLATTLGRMIKLDFFLLSSLMSFEGMKAKCLFFRLWNKSFLMTEKKENKYLFCHDIIFIFYCRVISEKFQIIKGHNFDSIKRTTKFLAQSFIKHLFGKLKRQWWMAGWKMELELFPPFVFFWAAANSWKNLFFEVDFVLVPIDRRI